MFTAALVEQLGLPIPAAPILLAAGALAASGALSVVPAVILASIGSVVADAVWYSLGRSKGSAVLNLLCRISLETDSCVSRTKDLFQKLGPLALVIAKFVPGLSTVAPPLAGVTRMRLSRFLVLDSAGSVLWAGVYVLLGHAFHRQLERVAASAWRFGSITGMVLGALLALYIAVKFWRRQRFIRSVRTMRISPEELSAKMDAGERPSVIDLRHVTDLEPSAMRIPGSIWFRKSDLERRHVEIPRDRDVILYCSCPNEATSAGVALALHKLGITRVRPLLGGFDEWFRRGYPVEPVAALGVGISV